MKNIRRDDEALIPLLVGVGVTIAVALGFLTYQSTTTTVTNIMHDTMVCLLGCMFVLIGVLALMGKFMPVLGKNTSAIVALAFMCVGGYWLYELVEKVM